MLWQRFQFVGNHAVFVVVLMLLASSSFLLSNIHALPSQHRHGIGKNSSRGTGTQWKKQDSCVSVVSLGAADGGSSSSNNDNDRRRFLSVLGIFGLAPFPAFALPFVSKTTVDVVPPLLQKISFPLSELSPGFLKAPVNGGGGGNDGDLAYPPFFAGTWNSTSTFVGKRYPLGERFVPSRIRRRGSLRREEDAVGDALSWPVRYVPGAGGEEVSVLPDRPYNIRQQINAQRGYDEVAEVVVAKGGGRTTVSLNTLGPDLRPLGRGRNELYTLRRARELSVPSTGDVVAHQGDVTTHHGPGLKVVAPKDYGSVLQQAPSYSFSTLEYYRTVTLGERSTAVLETATYTTYDVTTATANTIDGRQRVCLFLPPLPSGEEGDLYFEAANRAVAVYDYDLTLTKVLHDHR